MCLRLFGKWQTYPGLQYLNLLVSGKVVSFPQLHLFSLFMKQVTKKATAFLKANHFSC